MIEGASAGGEMGGWKLKPSMRGAENLRATGVACRYCEGQILMARHGYQGPRVACRITECQRARLRDNWVRVRRRQRQQESEARLAEPVREERACSNCGDPTTNRMLCTPCFRKG